MSDDKSRLSVSIRVSPKLRDELVEAARRNSHSMNAEIVDRLEGVQSTAGGVDRLVGDASDLSAAEVIELLEYLLPAEQARLDGIVQGIFDMETAEPVRERLKLRRNEQLILVEDLKLRLDQLRRKGSKPR